MISSGGTDSLRAVKPRMSVKSTVEQLSPTRVRINVEVPFEELKPDFDRAYKALAKQVRIPGFRPGKAPAKLLESRIGRPAVLEQLLVADLDQVRFAGQHRLDAAAAAQGPGPHVLRH